MYVYAAAIRAGLLRADWDALEQALLGDPEDAHQAPGQAAGRDMAGVIRSKWIHGR